jgi:predicted enzyme related to lactoylglutathione lyase
MENPMNFGVLNSFVFSKETNREKINFSIGEIGELELKVKNIEKAVEFYRNKLDSTVLYTDQKSAVCECNGVRFMLTKSDVREKSSVLYLKVDDIHATHSILKDRAVEFYDLPKSVVNIPGYKLWLALFHDIDNNLLVLMSENPVEVLECAV